jgi:hypothetical protein
MHTQGDPILVHPICPWESDQNWDTWGRTLEYPDHIPYITGTFDLEYLGYGIFLASMGRKTCKASYRLILVSSLPRTLC